MGAAAAAIIAAKQRKMIEAFELAGATSAVRARSLDEVRVEDVGIVWRQLRSAAIIREAEPGKFYLDIEVWQASVRRRRRMALIIIVVLLFVALALALTSRARLQ